MVVYTGGLLLYSSIALDDIERLWRGILVVLVYVAVDLLWTYVKSKRWYLPISSLISGFILSLVAIPEPPLVWLVILPLLAVFSKQVLWFGKVRHLLNPASFAMGVGAFLIPAVSWWGVAWGRIGSDSLATILFIVIIAVGAVILWRQNRWHIALPFLVSYAILLALLFFMQGVPVSRLSDVVLPLVFDGTVFFFATVMLIEPLTSTYPRMRDRVWYGVLVGFFAVFVTYLSTITIFSTWNLYPLVYGLLLGNLVAGLLFLRSRKPVQSVTSPISANNKVE